MNGGRGVRSWPSQHTCLFCGRTSGDEIKCMVLLLPSLRPRKFRLNDVMMAFSSSLPTSVRFHCHNHKNTRKTESRSVTSALLLPTWLLLARGAAAHLANARAACIGEHFATDVLERRFEAVSVDGCTDLLRARRHQQLRLQLQARLGRLPRDRRGLGHVLIAAVGTTANQCDLARARAHTHTTREELRSLCPHLGISGSPYFPCPRPIVLAHGVGKLGERVRDVRRERPV